MTYARICSEMDKSSDKCLVVRNIKKCPKTCNNDKPSKLYIQYPEMFETGKSVFIVSYFWKEILDIEIVINIIVFIRLSVVAASAFPLPASTRPGADVFCFGVVINFVVFKRWTSIGFYLGANFLIARLASCFVPSNCTALLLLFKILPWVVQHGGLDERVNQSQSLVGRSLSAWPKLVGHGRARSSWRVSPSLSRSVNLSWR